MDNITLDIRSAIFCKEANSNLSWISEQVINEVELQEIMKEMRSADVQDSDFTVSALIYRVQVGYAKAYSILYNWRSKMIIVVANQHTFNACFKNRQ